LALVRCSLGGRGCHAEKKYLSLPTNPAQPRTKKRISFGVKGKKEKADFAVGLVNLQQK
jgi:hypothetical protein